MNILFLSGKCNKLKICIEIFFKTLEYSRNILINFKCNITIEELSYITHVAIVFKKRLMPCNLYGCNDLYCASDGRIMRSGDAVYFFFFTK